MLDSYQLEISHVTLTQKLSSVKIGEIIKTLTAEEKKLPINNHLLIIDAGAIAGIRHLKACIHFSIQSFAQKENLAKNLNTEILLYLSGYRQISKAIKKIGLNSASKEIITIHLRLPVNSDTNSFFNFEQYLEERKITYSNFRKNVDFIPLVDEKKLLANLEIMEEEITLYLQDNSEEREAIIEKIAIEKSSLLNLLK
jgi:tRNA threonylcarbamoyladenosine modification (KEOPS) complex Cgi121 subunit